MSEYDSKKVGIVLKALRKSKKWSQTEMARELSIVMKKVFTDENGKNTVSQLERGARGITLDYAFAYADIFDVSLDYILGRSDDWKPENKSIKEVINISDSAIKKLQSFIKHSVITQGKEKHYKIENVQAPDEISELIEHDIFIEFINDFKSMKNPGKGNNERAQMLQKLLGSWGVWEYYRQQTLKEIDNIICNIAPKPEKDEGRITDEEYWGSVNEDTDLVLEELKEGSSNG